MTDPSLSRTLKDARYELFMLVISFLTIFNAILVLFPWSDPIARQVLYVMGGILFIPLMADFSYRLLTATSRRNYFVREWGWTDLVAAFPNPLANGFRLVRSLWVIDGLRQRGKKKVLQELRRNRGETAVLAIISIVVLILEFAGWGIVKAEAGDPAANIQSGADGLWWVLVTITTVGYGDRFPVTGPGRVVGALTMAAGVATIGIIIGTLSARFVRFSMGDDDSDKAGSAARWEEVMRVLRDQARATAAVEQRLDRIERKLPGSEPKARRKPGERLGRIASRLSRPVVRRRK